MCIEAYSVQYCSYYIIRIQVMTAVLLKSCGMFYCAVGVKSAERFEGLW